MVFFNVWAENLDKYIYFKYFLLSIIWIIIFIIFYDFIKWIILKYKTIISKNKLILEKKQTILQDIDDLLLQNWKLFVKNFLFFLEKYVNIWKYSIENLLERIDWKKEDLYKMIYSNENKDYKNNEDQIRKLLLDYKKWLEK